MLASFSPLHIPKHAPKWAAGLQRSGPSLVAWPSSSRKPLSQPKPDRSSPEGMGSHPTNMSEVSQRIPLKKVGPGNESPGHKGYRVASVAGGIVEVSNLSDRTAAAIATASLDPSAVGHAPAQDNGDKDA